MLILCILCPSKPAPVSRTQNLKPIRDPNFPHSLGIHKISLHNEVHRKQWFFTPNTWTQFSSVTKFLTNLTPKPQNVKRSKFSAVLTLSQDFTPQQPCQEAILWRHHLHLLTFALWRIWSSWWWIQRRQTLTKGRSCVRVPPDEILLNASLGPLAREHTEPEPDLVRACAEPGPPCIARKKRVGSASRSGGSGALS
jgi:hypothetical protein